MEDHVTAAWRDAGALVVHKMLGELSYEGLLRPTAEGPDGWRLELVGGAVYRFAARRGAFESWSVRPGSATRDGAPADDPRELVVDARTELGLTGLRLADVLAELTATVANEAARLARAPSAAELSTMDYDEADGHLTGHPRLVLNKGRVGFSAHDRARYAPEAGAGFALPWLAVHRDHASFRCVGALSEERLLTAELGAAKLAAFRAKLDDPGQYVLVPVHPWQLDEVVGTLYAKELATGAVVHVGESADRYRPHQTVRTLANASHPTRYDVKTAVSVRNTLVYRGLASAATLAAPEVTTWLRAVHDGDELLRDTYRFDLLGEIASVSVKHPLFGAVEELPYRFHETLGALWREPIRTRLADGERAISFAALTYRGPDGGSVAAHLVAESGMAVEDWLRRLLDILLTPLLHWLLEHGVGFCPHGQNLILVTDGRGAPKHVAIKDFAQGVDLLDEPLPGYDLLGPAARADMLRWPAHLLAQSLFSSVFAGQLRFLAEVLDEELGYPRPRLWALVREIVGAYRDAHPDTAARFDACGLFDPEVERVCLNREHLAGQGFDKVDRDDEFDVRFGRARNPLAAPDPDGAW
ncbi:IucA/IucC family protein [Actinokineospora sp. NBRC 105648]|uniref:IucA/IucC family protein n=1 Tax=Actinokineospora sp. NBRC 105648 TaxID=3032206 RepID=UPI0024A27E65|nr:IucA/IucC family protein [Actinokineospora sp. NBRC 105648]GLZ38995.1 siderophore biosynthesis protein IucA [Actinokineospora sp. NBRC 105648]